jgi:hypothetical protein
MRINRLVPVLIVTGALSCRGQAPPAPDPVKPLSPAATIADVATFRSAVEEGHAALDRYRPRGEVREKLAELEAAARGGLSPIALWTQLTEFAAFVADAHLQVRPSQAVYDRIYRDNLLPVSVSFHDGRCVVVESLTPAIPKGAEILSIGGFACDRIPETFGRVIPTDGRNEARRRFVLERDFPIFLALLDGLQKRIAIEFRNSPTAAATTLVVNTMSIAEKQSLRGTGSSTEASRFAHTLDTSGSDTAVLRIRSFEKTRENHLPAFLDRSFGELSRRGTKNLVIDLRGNSGGRDAYAALLYSHIAETPFRYVEERVLNAKSFAFVKGTEDWWLNLASPFFSKKRRADGKWVFDQAIDGEQRPLEHPFAGRVVLLIDASAFSTASEFASIFKSARRGLIVGEESGNAYQGDSGASVSIALPNSGITANIPIVEYRLAVRPLQPLDRGVLPDCAVDRRWEETFTGIDSMLPEAVYAASTGACRDR